MAFETPDGAEIDPAETTIESKAAKPSTKKPASSSRKRAGTANAKAAAEKVKSVVSGAEPVPLNEAAYGLYVVFALAAAAMRSQAQFTEADPEFKQLAAALKGLAKFFPPINLMLRVFTFFGVAPPLRKLLSRLLEGRPRKAAAPAAPLDIAGQNGWDPYAPVDAAGAAGSHRGPG